MHDPEHSLPTPRCVAAILPAAGSGRRFGTEHNKLFAMLAGKPLWYHAAARLAARPEIGRIIMPIAESDRERFESDQASLLGEWNIELTMGGEQRTDSVRSALDTLSGDDAVRFVAVHDAARPLVPKADLASVFAVAFQTGAAILASPVSGTIKRDRGPGQGCETVDRRELWIALTPQVFRIDLLRQAYDRHRGRSATDDAQLVERLGHSVSLVRGSAENIKITNPEDLLIAAAILERQSQHAQHQST